MDLKRRIVDYFLITSFVWGMYLLWLIPFQLYWIQLSWEQFTDWVIYGTMLEMVFTYPIAKMVTRYAPRITKWVENL